MKKRKRTRSTQAEISTRTEKVEVILRTRSGVEPSARAKIGPNPILLSAVLVAVTLAVYWQVGGHGFITYDDNVYVVENLSVLGGISAANIVWAFTSVEASNWHPITWLSHIADAHLYGLNPGGHHLTSVVIHVVSAVLLLLLLYRVTASPWKSALVAALFALHPLHVQSVAWVAERKDVISAMFWFLTLLCYAQYAATRTRMYYLLTLFSFVLGLMAKPMLVTLPVTMLLFDFWPLNRVRSTPQQPGRFQLSGGFAAVAPLVKEKIPFFLLSLVSAAITVYAQHEGGAIESIQAKPFALRFENAAISYVTYLAQTLWPERLAIFYPYPSSFPVWQFLGSVFILIIVTALVVRAGRRQPYLLMGWLWYVITLIPVIGLVQVGSQSMADRYTYIPLTGVFIMAAWGIPALTANISHRKMIHALIAGTALIACVVMTWKQLAYWRSNEALFGRAVEVTKDNSLAHNNLGVARVRKGDLGAAIREFRTAATIAPWDFRAHGNLGLALARTGDLDGAIAAYKRSLTANPYFLESHINLGVAYEDKGDLDAAIKSYRAALAISPSHPTASKNLGIALARKSGSEEVINAYRDALAKSPNDFEAHNSLGVELEGKGDIDAAIKEYEKAIVINPKASEPHNNLGVALGKTGNLDGAIREFRQAIAIEPNSFEAHFNHGIALARKGDRDAAIKELRLAVQIDPDSVQARRFLSEALSGTGGR